MTDSVNDRDARLAHAPCLVALPNGGGPGRSTTIFLLEERDGKSTLREGKLGDDDAYFPFEAIDNERDFFRQPAVSPK